MQLSGDVPMSKSDQYLSVLGDSCPVPLIKITRKLADLKDGQVLSITGDDPIFESSIRDYCEANDLEIIDVTHLDRDQVTILIRKTSG